MGSVKEFPTANDTAGDQSPQKRRKGQRIVPCERCDLLLYRYLPLSLLCLGFQLFGTLVWDSHRYGWLLGGLLIAIGVFGLASIGGHWAFGSVTAFWSLKWL